MRFLFLPLIFLVTSLSAQGTQEKPSRIAPIPDNFIRIMSEETPDREELDTLFNHAIQYLFRNQDSCLLVAQRGLELSRKYYPGENTEGDALMTLGDAYRVRSKNGQAKEVLLEGLELYRKLGNEKRTASALMKLGSLSISTEEYEASLDYSFAALETFERLNDSVNGFKPYFEIMSVFAQLDQPEKALFYNDKALKWGESMEWSGVIRVALGNQSELENTLANKYQRMADTATTRKNILLDSVTYFQTQALGSINRTLKLLADSENRYRVTIALIQLGDLQSSMGDYAKALETTKRALGIAEELESGSLLLSARLALGKTQRLMGQPQAAINTFQSALAMKEAEKNAVTRSNLQEQLYHAHKELEQYAEALTNFEAFTAFAQENERTERTEAINTIEGRFQTAKKEKQILELGIANAEIRRQQNLFLGGAGLLTLLGFLGFQLSRLRTDRNRKRQFANQLIDAQEEERKRIARDLHDGIGQSLLVIKRQLDANQQSTLENRTLVASTLEEVRSISRDLHPVLLEKFGITTTISDIVERINTSNPELFMSKEIADIDSLVSQKAEVQIFRVVQEALSNVVKHARATAVRVSVTTTGGGVEVIVQDNGVGFDEATAQALSKSLGLRTMQERIESVNGKFTIKRGEQKGMIVRLWVPEKSR